MPVLTAVPDSQLEAGLVAAFAEDGYGVSVVRRCVDLADLLAVAATRIAVVAIVSAQLRRLDRDAVASLAADGVAVVVLAGDEAAERRARQLGVAAAVRPDAPLAEVAAAVHAAAGRPAQPGEPAPPVPALRLLGHGQLIAVWGPTGAPGRTTVALGIAAELGRIGAAPLLVDADVYGGAIAALLGFLEEAPGLAAACRLANAGSLDVPGLGGLLRDVGGGLRVLAGISRPARWPELRPAAFGHVLELCRASALVTVVDCGFSLERDEDLSYDTAAPQRNGATLAALDAADTVIAVGSADPIGLQRLIRGLAELRETVPAARPLVVVNRARRGAVNGPVEREVGPALQRYAGVTPVGYLPLDLAACDAALAAGRSLAEVAPGSALRRALGELAARVTGQPVTGRRRRWGARRSA